MTAVGATRHGPNLPYSLVAGVTPCPGGWLVASAKLQGTIFAPEDPTKLERFIDVVDQRPSYSTVALNAPVGYLSHTATGGRSCDREVRALLGGRGAAVKSAPVRLDSQRDIDLLPDHLDAISHTLLARYREVANEMAPFRQRTIYEVNAELSFYQLNDDTPMRWAKHREKGIEERRELVESEGPRGIEDLGHRGSRHLDLTPSRRRRDPLDGKKDLCQGRGPRAAGSRMGRPRPAHGDRPLTQGVLATQSE